MVTGLLSMRTVKSSLFRSGTGLPWESVTTTSRSITWTSTLSRKAGRFWLGVLGSGPGDCWAAAAPEKRARRAMSESFFMVRTLQPRLTRTASPRFRAIRLGVLNFDAGEAEEL